MNVEEVMPSSSFPSCPSREAMYKNKGMTSVEMRKRRETNTAQLRKQKRDTEISKRRNIVDDVQAASNCDGDDLMGDAMEIFDERNLANLFSEDLKNQETAMRLLRRRLCNCEDAASIDNAVALGLVERFTSLLGNASRNIRRDAVSILGAIVASTCTHTQSVVQSGALPILIQFLGSEDDEIRERSLLAIGNIAGDGSANRDLCISLGAMPGILKVWNTSMKLSELSSAVWTVSNLCRGKNPPPDFKQVSTSLPLLGKHLHNNEIAIVGDVCAAIASLCDGTNEEIEQVVQSGVVGRLTELLLNPNPVVAANALRAIGNIVTGTDEQTQVVLSCPVLDSLQKLLLIGKESTKKEVCWTLSNILAGNRKQIQAVINANVLPSLVHVLASGDFKTRKEACWAISNALSGGSTNQVATVIREGAILPLCDLLTVMDPKIVKVALNALESILRTGEHIKSKSKTGINPYCALIEEARGIDKLEFLQQSPNLEIYVKAFDLIENYFAGDEPEDEIVTLVEANGDNVQGVGTALFTL